MPWIPIVPTKSNPPVTTIAPESKVESRGTDQPVSNVKDRLSCRANSKKFFVSVRSVEQSRERSSEVS